MDNEEKKVIVEFRNDVMKSESSQIVIVKDHFGDNGPAR